MAKKKHKSRNTKSAEQVFPLFDKLEPALEWWRNRIRNGLPLFGAQEQISGLASLCENDSDRLLIASLQAIAGDEVTALPNLNGTSTAVNHIAVDRDRVFAATATGGITCHDLQSGKKLWSIPAELALQVGGMTVSGKTLFYTDSWNGKVRAVSVSNGEELWSIEAFDNSTPLLSPTGLAVQHIGGQSRLLVCDSSAHCLIALSLDGQPQGRYGTRGLADEEIAHRHSAPDGTSIPPYFEYPREVFVAEDADNREAIFVWDSGNGRVVVLDEKLDPKRSIEIVSGHDEVKPRLTGQVSVANGASGPVVIAVDDVLQVMSVFGPEGESLLAYDLASLLRSPGRKAGIVRVSVDSEQGIIACSNNGRMFRFADSVLDSVTLSGNLLRLFPEDSRLVLAGIGTALEPSSNSNGETFGNWRQLSPALDPSALADSLLDEQDILCGRLARTVALIDSTIDWMEQKSLAVEVAAFRQAVEHRLKELNNSMFTQLMNGADPSAAKLESWSDAQSEVDMELFQSRGKLSSAELAMDDQLEQVRELRPSIRKTGWKLGVIHGVLLKRLDSEWAENTLEELLAALDDLLDKRLETLAVVAGQLDYERDPQRVVRDEIQNARKAELKISAIDETVVVLSKELIRFGATGIDKLKQRLADLLEKSVGLACHEILTSVAGGSSLTPNKLDPLPSVPELNGNAAKAMQDLVSNMGTYMVKAKAAADQGGKFGLVLQRQRHLFALKASVISNFVTHNVNGCDQLEKAREIAGDAWPDSIQLRPVAESVEAGR